MNLTVQRLASRRFDVLLTLVGLLGIVLFLTLYNEAFPDATIELPLARDQIMQRANDYLKSQGYDVGGYESVVDFNQAWWASDLFAAHIGRGRDQSAGEGRTPAHLDVERALVQTAAAGRILARTDARRGSDRLLAHHRRNRARRSARISLLRAPSPKNI